MRIAIFGGTFDPVHDAHLAVAIEAARAFNLDHVLMVPAGCPPHKNNQARTPWPHRFRMVELACAGYPQLAPSRLEEGEQKSYSIDTIGRVERGPGDTLYFIIGADAFAEIQTWKRWRDVIAQVEFIVVSRPGHDYAIPEGARVHRLDGIQLQISSTEIRAAIARGEHPPGLNAGVWRYIVEKHLYDAA